MEGKMFVLYRSSTRVERTADVTIDETTIDDVLAALEAMAREGMPGDAELSITKQHDGTVRLHAFSACDMPAIREML